MANTRSAAKRARQTVRRTTENRRVTRGVKASVKSVRDAVKEGEKADAVAAARKASSTLDKAVKSGQIHRNKANRQKSRLAKAAAALK